MSANGIITVKAGGNGGGPFGDQAPNAIGVSSGDVVDALWLNGVRYGGSGGSQGIILTLGASEYFSSVTANTGKEHNGDTVVTYLQLTTNLGRVVVGGDSNNSNGKPVVYSGCRVLNLAGQCGDYLDQLQIQLCADYVPSASQTSAQNPTGATILAIAPGGTTITSYTDSSTNIVSSTEATTTFNISTHLDASAQAEYYGFYSVSTGLSTSFTTMTDITNCTTSYLENQTTTTINVPPNQTGFYIGAIFVMQDSSGNAWTYINAQSSANWVILTPDQYPQLVNSYCLANGVTQQTGLQVQVQNGVPVIVS